MTPPPHDSDQPIDQGSRESEWFLYLIRCKGGQLYTGISTDVARRFAAHQLGKGAKFLRGKAPLVLVFQQKIGSRSEALKTEAAVKKLARADKENIISSGHLARI
ncbi:MAG: hypothetical protein COX55_00975 [Zetaproteobacteria bacterium CG23_combo_of_CG06-09_8_20_14_all_54_7]|nr:MAG: hypothetical protein COX55_00975 [Zetaproteobacteria bacterium CG23_combo_of_CG06-09_8_20_14_all_54_7]